MSRETSSGSKRVLLLLEAALGGTGTHILDLAKGLSARGREVHLIYSTDRADTRFDEGLAQLRRDCPAIELLNLPMSREVGPKDLYWIDRLRRYLRRHGPFAVIHCHSTKAGFVGRLATMLPGVAKATPVVYTPHSLMMLNPSVGTMRRKMVAALERSLARVTDRIIVISEAERRVALEHGIPEGKLQRIPNGVPVATLRDSRQRRLEIRTRLGIGMDEIAVALVGRLCFDKDPQLAFQAFAVAQQATRMRLRLVVAGEGELEPELRTLADRLGIADRILWTGPIDAPAHMAGFDVLLHSSRFEGLCYVFLEALAAGLPIVTTPVGGVENELVIPGQTGYVAADRDPATLGNLLAQVADDEAMRRGVPEAARELLKEYELDTMVDRIDGLYHELAMRHRLRTGNPATDDHAASSVKTRHPEETA